MARSLVIHLLSKSVLPPLFAVTFAEYIESTHHRRRDVPSVNLQMKPANGSASIISILRSNLGEISTVMYGP